MVGVADVHAKRQAEQLAAEMLSAVAPGPSADRTARNLALGMQDARYGRSGTPSSYQNDCA